MNEITMVAAAVLLLLAGAGMGFLWGRKGRSDATSKLEETRTEFDDYRQRVTRHFDQTAQQFQAIGQQYRALYEHMADGAQAFCVPTDAGSALPFSAQTRLPGDVEDAEEVIDEAPELVAEQQPGEHDVAEAAGETTLETEAAADVTRKASVEAAEIEDEETGEPGLAAESAAEDAAGIEEKPTAAVEPAAEKPAEDSERIYH